MFFTALSNDYHRFAPRYQFQKPNDARALNLMNAAAKAVMQDVSDLIIAYGVSDEFRYLCKAPCGSEPAISC